MNIVIIGGVAAGAKAASKIKRLLPNSKVTVFTDDTHVSYSSCGIPYYIEGNFTDYKLLLVRSVEEFKSMGIDIYLQSKVIKILPEQRQVLVCDNNSASLVEYDKLIVATGATPFIPDNLNLSSYNNIFTVRKIEDGLNIRDKMLSSKSAVIVGSGYIGMEILEAFVKNGLRVSVIEKNNKIMSVFDDDISNLIFERIKNEYSDNIEFYTGETITEISGENGLAESVKLSSGKEIQTDIVIFCAGVVPNVQVAADAGIELGKNGAIRVNKLMQTSIENVYACGDCAEKTHIVSGKEVWIPLGSTANKEGRCAAINASGEFEQFEGVLGSAVTRCLNTTMSMTGLTEKQAASAGFTPVSVRIDKLDRVGYMPDAGEIYLKVVADRVTGLILGAQAIGAVGADKRINSLTPALLSHMTVDEYSNNDLTYSPPYSPTIDPLLNAMMVLKNKIRE